MVLSANSAALLRDLRAKALARRFDARAL